ncbi:DENN domain-containing protein 2B isoform X2 [Aplysia californica]|uniref:DENN domain-containing protein 2B isoform X2 n=1 Tax=Aplysia californica TaxID=6500 RepID=A0ABM1W375_APLCA|nr:DENN domain-containing protein 2B isoform X2 [Aplysia californica]
MSSPNHEGSIRHLPPGKLSNIKKLFEEDSNGDKPSPPSRPPAPSCRPKSSQARPKVPPPQRPASQPQAAVAAQVAANVSQLRETGGTSNKGTASDKNLDVNRLTAAKDPRRLSPTISRRITALMDNRGAVKDEETNVSNSAISQPQSIPKASPIHGFPKPGHRRGQSYGDAAVVLDNPVYGGFESKTRADPVVSEPYAKVNKHRKNETDTKKVKFDSEEVQIHRREAVRKNSGERRKTVACISPEDENGGSSGSGVSVAGRTKLFDSPKGEKPALPVKSESVKRQFSMRTAKEFQQQQQQKPVARITKAPVQDENTNAGSNSGLEAIYDPPWDLSKNPLVDKVKKAKPPSSALLPPSSTPGSPAKSAAPIKPPLPSLPPPKKDSPVHRTFSNVESGNESGALRRSKAQGASNLSDSPSKSTPAPPPPKPPRTHAHDSYLKVKLSQNLDTSSSSDSGKEQLSNVKKVQVVEPDSKVSDTSEEVEYLSVKDRISKMQQQKAESPPLSSSPPVSSSSSKDQTVVLRHQHPPSRPPPPRRRPNSGGAPPPLPPAHHLKSRPVTQFSPAHGDGPIVIPVSPRRFQPQTRQMASRQLSHTPGFQYQQRQPNDKLPPAPDGERPLQRFPLRKSFSSECIHSSQGSSLNLDETEDMTTMMQSTYESQYEAVIDAEGYAVPNEFMKLPGRRRADSQFDEDEVSPGQFLTRLEGFEGPDASAHNSNSNNSPGWGFRTATQEQTLDKVNKRKMNMVKQKINQAYADLDIAVRGSALMAEEDDWLVVEHGGHKESTETGVEQSELKRRVEHCMSVRLKSSKSIKHSKEYLSAIYPQLFEYCLVVGLRPLVDSSGYEPYVIHKFPENRNYKVGSHGKIYMSMQEVSSNLSVPSFCFPDAGIFKPGSATAVSESYSFVMTYSDGSRVYGYCRRVQPPDASLPEVTCIISPIDAFNMYNTLLNEIESRRRVSSDLAMEVIAASFGRPLPKPGRVCNIRTLDNNGDMETIFLTRSSDNRLENVNYESPLCYLGTDKLVKVFSAMLMERRVMLCSANLSVLTQTVHALAALMYPFQWQHVYIPLLPQEMLDVVCAPMPYILGVLSAFLPSVLKMEMEEVLIVDLDKKSIVRSYGDESTIIPRKLQRALKTAINMCKIDTDASNAQWLMIAEAFLRMFIEAIGHFGNHIRTQQDGNRIFQKEGFILEMVSKEMRQFLEWFTETQMFEVFICNHLEKADYGTNDLFVQRLAENKETKDYSRRHKGLGAKVKNFGKALKTKLQAS